MIYFPSMAPFARITALQFQTPVLFLLSPMHIYNLLFRSSLFLSPPPPIPMPKGDMLSPVLLAMIYLSRLFSVLLFPLPPPHKLCRWNPSLTSPLIQSLPPPISMLPQGTCPYQRNGIFLPSSRCSISRCPVCLVHPPIQSAFPKLQ